MRSRISADANTNAEYAKSWLRKCCKDSEGLYRGRAGSLNAREPLPTMPEERAITEDPGGDLLVEYAINQNERKNSSPYNLWESSH